MADVFPRARETRPPTAADTALRRRGMVNGRNAACRCAQTQTLGLAALGARLRIGDWRVIFIEDVRSITVIGVGNRNETYDCEGSVMTERFKMTNKGEVAILVRTCRITWPPLCAIGVFWPKEFVRLFAAAF